MRPAKDADRRLGRVMIPRSGVRGGGMSGGAGRMADRRDTAPLQRFQWVLHCGAQTSCGGRVMKRIVLLAVIASAATGTLVAAQLYRWVDEKGNVEYRDTPPPKDAK